MKFKSFSLFTFFFFICLITVITSEDSSELQKVKVISPTEGEVIPNGSPVNVKYETTKKDDKETISLHVCLINKDKYQIYQLVYEQVPDGNTYEFTIPWDRIQYDEYYYIRFYENYIPADSPAVQRPIKDIKIIPSKQ